MDLLLLTAIDPFSYQITPDLGLLYVAAAAREAGFGVELKDCRKLRWDCDDLAAFVGTARPAVVGIKSFSNEAARVDQMAAAIKQASPGTLVVVGGPHPSMAPALALKHMPSVDYFFLGDGEVSLPRFLRWVLAGRPGNMPDEVRGIAWRGSDGLVVREPEWIEDLDRLPLPAWDLMPPDQYADEALGLFAPAFPAAPVMMSRGCPHRCNYCGSQAVAGRRYRYRSVASLLAEIDFLERNYGVRTFAFVDNSFTSNRKVAVEFFEALVARPKPVFFTFPNGVRASSLDEELVRLMERAGCRLVGFGVESAVDATLKRMEKDQTAAQVTEKIALVRRESDIYITGSYILGYPGDSIEDVRRTIRHAWASPAHHAHFCVFIPLPGSPVYDRLVAAGQLDPDRWDPEALTMDRTTGSLPGLPRDQLVRLHQWAYIRFYIKPWRLVSLLRQIKSFSHFRVILRVILKTFV